MSSSKVYDSSEVCDSSKVCDLSKVCKVCNSRFVIRVKYIRSVIRGI